jgi:flagellar FliJ protein
MKKFRFPLRPVAVLRAHRQARAREAFAAAVHGYVQAEEHLAGVRARRTELETVMHDGRRATFRAADEVAFWGAYRLVCADEISSERALIEARARMEERRQDYIEAHRDVKIVDKLESKARTLHRLEAAREAQLDLDEMGGFRVARRLAASTVVSP